MNRPQHQRSRAANPVRIHPRVTARQAMLLAYGLRMRLIGEPGKAYLVKK